jgi:hypothetical protein
MNQDVERRIAAEHAAHRVARVLERLVGRDREQDDVGVLAQRLGELRDGRHLFETRPAGLGPEVEDHCLAAKRAELQLAAAERGQFEVRRQPILGSVIGAQRAERAAGAPRLAVLGGSHEPVHPSRRERDTTDLREPSEMHAPDLPQFPGPGWREALSLLFESACFLSKTARLLLPCHSPPPRWTASKNDCSTGSRARAATLGCSSRATA